MSKRKQITRITVEFKDGKTREIIVNDPEKDLPEAIFFRDMAVKEILAPFYEKKKVTMTEAEAKKNWGPEIIRVIFDKSTKKPITPSFIDKLWNTPDAGKQLRPMIIKKPGCPLE